jgi:hypothetical protein
MLRVSIAVNIFRNLCSIGTLCLLNCATATIQVAEGRMLVNPVPGLEHAYVICDEGGFICGMCATYSHRWSGHPSLCECCVFLGRGLRVAPITRPEESY